MSSTLTVRMNAIAAELAAKYPARKVTRNLHDFAQREDADLVAGIYTIVSRDEGDYTNTMGREAYDGKHKIGMLAQIRVEPFEAPAGVEDKTPSMVEDAEGVMIDEVKALMRSRTPLTNSLRLVRLQQSRQLEAPYGWVAFDFEMQGD